MTENPHTHKYEREKESSTSLGRFWNWTKQTAAQGSHIAARAWNETSSNTQDATEKLTNWRYEKMGTQGAGGTFNKIIDAVQTAFGTVIGWGETGVKGIAGFIQNITNRTETSIEHYQSDKSEDVASSTEYSEPISPLATPDARERTSLTQQR